MTLDVNDDGLPPDSAEFPLDAVRRPFKVTLPERVRKADVIRATGITKRGSTSDSVSVLIAD